MRVVIRADASAIIGSGHVMRCLTLATVLREQGAEVSFVCRVHDGDLCDRIAADGFPVTRLASACGSHSPARTPPSNADWLGVPWQDDAEYTRAAVEASGARPDWLVVDHYGLESQWETALRPATGRIFVIDDLANRPHNCDILLDQNLVAEMDTRYSARVPQGCQLLLGLKYALLNPIYAQLHRQIRRRAGKVKRVLISFGGGDRDNVTGRVVGAFLLLNRPDIYVDVVVGGTGRNMDAIRADAHGSPNIRIHSSLPTLALLMNTADLAIGGAGATSWERLCLGVPALVITLADNQRAAAAELERRGLIRWLGDASDVKEADIVRALRELVENIPALPGAAGESVDGRGTNRVSESLWRASFPLRTYPAP